MVGEDERKKASVVWAVQMEGADCVEKQHVDEIFLESAMIKGGGEVGRWY